MNSGPVTGIDARGKPDGPTGLGSSDLVRTAGLDPNPAHWLGALLQANDSFYPTGSYAHSFGLEPLIGEGVVRDRETLRCYLDLSVLPSLQHADLPLVVHAWAAFRDADWTAIAELSAVSSALKTAREARIASENIGRQRAELCALLRTVSLATDYLRRRAAADWPFAAGVSAALEAHVFGAPLEAALSGYAYSSVTAVVAAAMKLLRIGQNAGQALIAEALTGLPSLIAAAQATSRDDIGWFNPWLEIAGARHEFADARMFIS